MGERPVGTVRVAGLDPRDLRVIRFVLRHCDFNRYAYRIADEPQGEPDDAAADLVLANRYAPAGARLWALADPAAGRAARIELLPQGAVAAGGDAIALDRLAVQLLPVLNRAFERRLAAAAATAGAAGAPVEADAGSAGEGAERSQEELVEQFAEELADEFADELEDGLEEGLEDGLAGQARGEARAAARVGETGPDRAGEDARAEGEEAPRVLIVDDSPTVRRQIGVALDRLGLRHEAVGSAAEALERLAVEPFDLALVDVMMPDTDGYRLTREIRRDRRTRQLPVIILTSRSSPFDLARGALAGCDAYLTKPVPFRALETAVRKQLRRGGRAGDAAETARGAAQSRFARFLGR